MAQRHIENVQVRKAYDPPVEETSEAEVTETHPLDKPDAMERLRKLENWWSQARQVQAESRYEQAIDQDFYDGLQWSDEDRHELMERGQMPFVFNRIKPPVDWILGSEKRARMDFKVYPRGEEDTALAEVKTKLLKYVSDVNKSGFSRSKAFADAVIVGVGWLEDGILSDPLEEPLYSRAEDWRNIWYDHLATEKDLSDARYVFRAKWVDLDLSQAMFPDRKEALQAASKPHNLFSSDDDEFYWLNNTITPDGRVRTSMPSVDAAYAAHQGRDRVRLVEGWYREPCQVQVLRGHPRYEGAILRDNDPDMAAVVASGQCTLFQATRLIVRCAIFIDGGHSDSPAGGTTGVLLQDVPSPYRHNRFPFTPVWGYRRGRDRTAYGVIRNLRDIQEDLNKRRSKALYILSTNKMIADNNAFDDWDEVAEEMYRPDGILRKRPGSEVSLFNETRIAEEHVQMERADAKYIQDVSGVTDENLGRETNAQSGKAIVARQEQGSLVTAELFDNLRLATQLQGELKLSLIEQYYDQPKIVRLLGPRGSVEFLRINEEGTGEEGLPEVENDITANKADFIVDTQDYRESVRLAMFESLMDLVGHLPPEISFNLLDLVVEMSDMPHKEELVQRIRKLNGQVDPDQADTPEGEEEALARMEAERAQAEMEQAAAQAQVEEQQAKAVKTAAEAELAAEKVMTEKINREATASRILREEAQPPEQE